MSRCVAEFNRLAVDGFVVSFYEGKEYVSASAECVNYAGALLVAIQWIDNSEFHM